MTTYWNDSIVAWGQDAKLDSQSFSGCRITGPAILYLNERNIVTRGVFSLTGEHAVDLANVTDSVEGPPRTPGVPIIECSDCLFVDTEFSDVWIWSNPGTLTRWQRFKRWLGGKT